MIRQHGSLLVVAACAFACSAPAAPGGPDRVKSTITAESPVVADGTSVSRLTVRVVDADGLPLPGVVVTLSSGSSSLELRQPLGATNREGVATGGATSTSFGEAIVNATAGGVELRRGAGIKFLQPCRPDEVRCGDDCVDLETDERHCGACDQACPGGPDGAEPTCAARSCGLACAFGRGDCDGVATNGCEADLTTPEHCGRCASTCTTAAGMRSEPTCEEPLLARCGFTCSEGWGSCDLRADNGCEQPLDVDAHCGACGSSCAALSFPHGRGACRPETRSCGAVCDAGWGDCDGKDETGCEADLASASHCGACGASCAGAPHASGRCGEGAVCGLSCDPGWGDCGPGDGCETSLAASVENCGGCGLACAPREHATPACSAAGCRWSCVAGFADCNGDLSEAGSDGCETDLAFGRCDCQRSPTFTTSSCVTVGSAARMAVGTRLQTAAGQPVSGAAVEIDAPGVQWLGPVTESPPGTYSRMAEAAPAPGTTRVTLAATAHECGGTARLRGVTVMSAAPAVAGPAGGAGGCSPMDGHARVKVVAAEDGRPLANAMVLLGSAPGQLVLDRSFPPGGVPASGSNVAYTDESGIAEFLDYGDAIAGNDMVTAGAAGRAYVTVAGVSASDLVLPLPLTMPPAQVRLGGTVTGPSYPRDNNGFLELALVTPTIDMDFVSSFNIVRLLSDEHAISASGLLCSAQYVIAANLHVPAQLEAGACRITGGEQWSLGVRAGGPVDLLALHARMPILTLLNSTGSSVTELLRDMQVQEIGILARQPASAGSPAVSVGLTHELTPTMPVTVAGAPTAASSTLYALALGDLDGGNGSGRMYLQGFRTAAGAAALAATLETNAPTGPFAGKSDLAAAIAVNELATSLVLERTTLDRTSPRTLTNFYAFPGGAVANRTFVWNDVAGSSPRPQVARSELRRVTEVGAYGETYEPFWIVWTPGDIRLADGRRGFTLPTLPLDAPRAPAAGYLPSNFAQRNEWFLALRQLAGPPAPTGFTLARHAFGTETAHVLRVATDRVELP